jgi:hypothetical protein
VGFVVDKVALGQVFSEHFGFPCQFSFHQFLHNHPHLSSGAGTIGQKVAAVLKVPQHKLKKTYTIITVQGLNFMHVIREYTFNTFLKMLSVF